MPPLDEGALFYMPSTMPGISITEAQKLLQVTDRIIKQFPEVDRVLGKAGRAGHQHRPGAALDARDGHHAEAAGPSGAAWTPGIPAGRPEWLKPVFRPFTPDRISPEELVNQLNEALKLPGVSNAWTMPIKARIDMLTTGIRTPVGLKITGDDLQKIEEIGTQIEALLPSGPRHAQRLRRADGRRLLPRHRVEPRRAGALRPEHRGGAGGRPERHRRRERHDDVEGRERYPVNVRYMRDFRSDLDALGRVLVPASGGQRQIPLGQLADDQGRHRARR